ncbi:MAG TPA: universal stress protein [Ktedonobacteraceae bacterium]|jgi:nucleotide-binding universal stress UspA family protein|nr:universal stress protein [Ktedonobacteraceae bacterium]
MFERILVPLDGSERAESAIPIAARVARAYDGSIVLLRVVTTPIEYGPYLAPSESLMRRTVEEDVAEATKYLERVAKSEALAGITVEAKALFGAAAPTIMDAIPLFQINLVAMCSHGYTGVKRWILGSVADKIVRYAPVPVFILRDGMPLTTTPEKPVRALVSLDGSALSEAVLEPAAYLVSALAEGTSARGELHLLRVVDLPYASSTLHSQAYITKETREKARADAEAYLEKMQNLLYNAGVEMFNITVSTSVASDPDVAEAIAKTAEGYDLIAMATHGRSGVSHFLLGSITERVLHTTKLPLMVVRPQKQAAKTSEEQVMVEGEEIVVNTSEEKGTEQGWVGLL